MSDEGDLLADHFEAAMASPATDPVAADRRADLATRRPADDHDAMVTLLGIHDLWTAPLPTLDGRERHQGDPAVATLKRRLEERFLARLDGWVADDDLDPADTAGAVDALRRIARRDRVPAVYDWLATTATYDQVVRFLALEGGPDADFDDLVAQCQVGIRGRPKVVLAANYWDELGGGDPASVHTVLHDRMAAALGLRAIPRRELPLASLDRMALNGLLATNRHLQPEMVGALGLLELQAGPRCRHVVRALHRIGAPADALPFYEEHAEVDPRHGKEWVDGVVAPLEGQHPAWGPRIVRGAQWRSAVNARMFADAHRRLTSTDDPAAVPEPDARAS